MEEIQNNEGVKKKWKDYNKWLESSEFINSTSFYDKYYLESLCHHLSNFIKNVPVPLLVDYNDKPLTNINSITYIINKIFKKKIGSSMLRHIYLSGKYGDELKERQKDANMMSHSVEMATDYIKTK
jgi:hypothetical protein